jgi:hypothetical protein
VLVLGFNRPDTTRRVLESLRAAKPARIFFAVDGPRSGSREDARRVAEVQSTVGLIDWPCQTKTLFRTANLGCKLAVSQAISWFFAEVESGVILEDDCIAHPSFFRFSAELLARYEGDERIWMISGDNFQGRRMRNEYSYYFSRYTHIWGWATWRRAWRHYDYKMSLWPQLRDQGWLLDMLKDWVAAEYWTRIFDDTFAERNSSWAYRWTYSAWVNNALTVLPCVNLVSNIGFGDVATHTRNRQNKLAALPVEEMRLPLRHPDRVIREARADTLTQRTVFASPPWWKRIAKKILHGLGRR